MKWSDDVLLPLPASDAAPAAPTPRFKGPDGEGMDSSEALGPWLVSAQIADAAQQLGRVCRDEASLSEREASIAILATAFYTKSSAEWTSQVVEARKAGLEEGYIGALARGAVPAFAA